jgi:hypothetical protein
MMTASSDFLFGLALGLAIVLLISIPVTLYIVNSWFKMPESTKQTLNKWRDET